MVACKNIGKPDRWPVPCIATTLVCIVTKSIVNKVNKLVTVKELGE